jgi:dipeptidase
LFLANHGIPVIQQPPHSPDMAPCDFWLFPKLKTMLQERDLMTDTIKENMTKHLSSIPKDLLKKYFQQWQNHWHKCIASQGDYFEGD